jgi:hypothetical protein
MASLPSWLQSLLPYSSLIGGGLGLVDSLLQPDQKTTTQGGTSNSTNTSSLQLPSQLTGGAGGALDRANQLLSQGYQVAPLGSAFNTAQDQLTNLPQNNAPTTSSFASGANINPYLDMTFNAAADATQNRGWRRVCQRGAAQLAAEPTGALTAAPDSSPRASMAPATRTPSSSNTAPRSQA